MKPLSAYKYHKEHVKDLHFIDWKKFLRSKLEYGIDYYDSCNDHTAPDIRVERDGDLVLTINKLQLKELEKARLANTLAIAKKHAAQKIENVTVAQELRNILKVEEDKLAQATATDFLEGVPNSTRAERIAYDIKRTRYKYLGNQLHKLHTTELRSVVHDLKEAIKRLEQ